MNLDNMNGIVLKYNTSHKDDRIYPNDTKNNLTLEEAIRNGIPFSIKRVYSDCSNDYTHAFSAVRCCASITLTENDMINTMTRWKIDDLMKDGNREEAVKLLLKDRKLKYPSINMT